MTEIVFVAAVWGPGYVKTWLDWSLPSLLASGNLPAAKPQSMVIVTREHDAAEMAAHPAFVTLLRLCPVDFVIDNSLPIGEAGRAHMTAAHQTGMRAAQGKAADPAICFLNADLVFADGTYATVRRLIDQGKRAVMTQGVSVSGPVFVQGLTLKVVLTLSAGQIVERARVATDNWNTLPQWRMPFAAHPSQLFWPLAEGLLMHCWHLFPLAIRVGNVAALTGTVDNDLTERCCRFDELAFLQDANEGCLISLEDDPLRAWGPRSGQPSPGRVAKWAAACSPMQRKFFALPFVFGRGTDAKAAETVNHILSFLPQEAA